MKGGEGKGLLDMKYETKLHSARSFWNNFAQC